VLCSRSCPNQAREKEEVSFDRIVAWRRKTSEVCPIGEQIKSIYSNKPTNQKHNHMKTLRTNKGSFKPGQKPIITKERNEKIRVSKIGQNNPNFGNKEAAKHLHVNVICEHCSKSISKGNYYRWHGTKCKLSVNSQ
jgi:hypothetical protein